MGPWGGYGGTDWDDGSYNGVREITLMYGRCIDSIRIVYEKNGKPVSAEKHGGEGGSKTDEVIIFVYFTLELKNGPTLFQQERDWMNQIGTSFLGEKIQLSKVFQK